MLSSVEEAKPEAMKSSPMEYPGPVSLDMVIGEKAQENSSPAEFGAEPKEWLGQPENNRDNSVEEKKILKKLKLELLLQCDHSKQSINTDVVKEIIEEARR